MFCEIARKLDDEHLGRIKSLEDDLGLTLVAFSCRSLDPAREERLQRIMDELGPQLQAPPAEPDDEQLTRIRALEEELGLTLIAVHAA
jgi:ribosome assembly protein YihI (activator of Der GTPase)